MSKRACCVNQCTNSWYQLKKWQSIFCSEHNCNFGTTRCVCDPPFKLLPFPSGKKDNHLRSVWVKNVYRLNTDGTNWQPNEDSRICSRHFVDGHPSADNPYPTLFMGHDYQLICKSRPPPKDRTYITPVKKRKSTDGVNDENCTYLANQQVPSAQCLHDHDYFGNCETCQYKDDEIRKLKAQIRDLKSNLEKCKNEVKIKTKTYKISKILSSDKKVKFYTGIPTADVFNEIFKIIEPSVKNRRYWRGPKYHCNTLKHKVFKNCRENRKLSAKEEMILTLMKLRLGLLDQDIADRFEISTSHVSRIFTTWIQILSKYLGSLVFNPPKEIVRENLPPKFQNAKFSDVRHIIDCSEIFIEKPQNMQVQAKTWSDYKHHHTAKFLVSITPAGMFNFVSDCWGGRTSDKHITNHSEFLDMVEPYDVILADRGFQIQEEVTLLNARLIVPPARKGVSQMTTAEVLKTKEIANHRIYIEQAIRRMKYFRILKFELPLTLCQHLDKIVKTICGICNLYPPLPKYSV